MKGWVDFISRKKTKQNQTMAMEGASCPVLNTLPFCTNNSSKLYNIQRKNLQFPTFSPRNFNSSVGKLYTDGLVLNSSSSFSNSIQETPSRQLAVLLEVEGYNSSSFCVYTVIVMSFYCSIWFVTFLWTALYSFWCSVMSPEV